jgi:aerobic-type carbon monoxide dehydrogenase small subunit (CoxS/CutS family)
MQAISFLLNGVPKTVITDPRRTLLEIIRKDLGLTGTKEGCSAGHRGTCTVLLEERLSGLAGFR